MTIDQHITVKPERKDVTVQAASVASLLDYPLESDDHMDQVIHNMIELGYKIITPAGGYIIKKIDHLDIKSGVLTINDVKFNIGRIVAAQLKKAEYAAFFYATISEQVEKESKEHISKGDLMEGYTLDLIGSEAAESVATIVHDTILSDVNGSGYKITNRFSPGYCDWDVKEQFMLFNLFENDQLPIHLNESALMKPIKSVSGLVGIGIDVSFKPYSCAKCSDDKCIYRNKKINQTKI